MSKVKFLPENIEFHPLTPDRWDDFETLFGPNGACAGCWCMWWLMTNKEFTVSRAEGHKNAMRTLVQSGFEPGLLAYADEKPVGWVAVAPRERYTRLNTAKKLFKVDDQPVWLISCFYIHRDYRRLGMMEKLIESACDFSRKKGANIIEAFPIDATEKISTLSLYTGRASVFRKMGFEVAVVREERPIMRKTL